LQLEILKKEVQTDVVGVPCACKTELLQMTQELNRLKQETAAQQRQLEKKTFSLSSISRCQSMFLYRTSLGMLQSPSYKSRSEDEVDIVAHEPCYQRTL
jgi:hypothetical protein